MVVVFVAGSLVLGTVDLAGVALVADVEVVVAMGNVVLAVADGVVSVVAVVVLLVIAVEVVSVVDEIVECTVVESVAFVEVEVVAFVKNSSGGIGCPGHGVACASNECSVCGGRRNDGGD